MRFKSGLPQTDKTYRIANYAPDGQSLFATAPAAGCPSGESECNLSVTGNPFAKDRPAGELFAPLKLAPTATSPEDLEA